MTFYIWSKTILALLIENDTTILTAYFPGKKYKWFQDVVPYPRTRETRRSKWRREYRISNINPINEDIDTRKSRRRRGEFIDKYRECLHRGEHYIRRGTTVQRVKPTSPGSLLINDLATRPSNSSIYVRVRPPLIATQQSNRPWIGLSGISNIVSVETTKRSQWAQEDTYHTKQPDSIYDPPPTSEENRGQTSRLLPWVPHQSIMHIQALHRRSSEPVNLLGKKQLILWSIRIYQEFEKGILVSRQALPSDNHKLRDFNRRTGIRHTIYLHIYSITK